MKKVICILFISLIFFSCNRTEKNSNRLKLKEKTENLTPKVKLIKIIGDLIIDYKKHQDIYDKMTEKEIKIIETEIDKKLPESYKFFLTKFGSGAYSIYEQPVDDLRNYSFLRKYRKNLDSFLDLNGEKIETNSLLCLMTEDSNGGAWVWLTGEKTENGEWPLAYYSISDNKLHFKVKNLIEWLEILNRSKR